MIRWRLETRDGSASYTFEINPNKQDSPYLARDIQWEFHHSTGFTGRRAGRTPHAWGFSGVLRSQAQYDALLEWVGKRSKVILIDDRNDRYLLRLLEFKPVQTAGARNRHAPWRMTYTVTAQIYELLPHPVSDSDAATATTEGASVAVTP